MPTIMQRTNSAARGSKKPRLAIPGPGQRPTSPQPTPKMADPPISRASIVFVGGSSIGPPASRPPPGGDAEGDEGDRDRAAHDEGERGIPRAGEVEEREHLARIDHARQAKADPEQESGEKRGSAAHRSGLQARRWRTTKTVRKPAAMKVAVAAIERGDNRATPQTP